MQRKRIYVLLTACWLGCGVKRPPVENPVTAEQKRVAACIGKPEDRFDLGDVICVDARNPDHVKVLRSATDRGETATGEPDYVIHPNHAIVARVMYSAEAKVVSVSLGGNGGQTIAEIAGGTPVAGQAQALANVSERSLCGNAGLFCKRFASRTPGVANLHIELQPPARPAAAPAAGGGPAAVPAPDQPAMSGGEASPGGRPGAPPPPAEKAAAPRVAPAAKKAAAPAAEKAAAPAAEPPTEKVDVEYLVPHIYAGAVRIGLSAIVGAPDIAYTSSPRSGDTGGVVRQLASSRITNEVVVGYAPFLESFGQRDGRDYVHKLKASATARFAPYLGLGVVAAATSSDGGTKVAWLKSLYLGAEYELVYGTSIAAGLVLRRVDRLADGLHVGDAVPSGTSLMDSRLMVGVGVVLNITPEFFKLAVTAGLK